MNKVGRKFEDSNLKVNVFRRNGAIRKDSVVSFK